MNYKTLYKTISLMMVTVICILVIVGVWFIAINAVPTIETFTVTMPEITPIPPETKIEVKTVELDSKTAEELFLEDLKEIEPLKDSDKQAYLMEYKIIANKYSTEKIGVHSVYKHFTEYEIRLIQKTVETETYDAPFNAKVNVANVIFNRFEDSEHNMPATIEEIITQEGQFCYGRDNISESTVLAVEYAFLFEDTTQGALWFDKGNGSWASQTKTLLFVDEVGHCFYK